MRRFARHCLQIILLLSLPACLVGWLWGLHAGLAAFAICLAAWLLLHLSQIGLLIQWLERPKLSTVPRGIGIWQQIFDTLLIQARSRKKRKQKLSQALQRFYRAAEAMPNGVILLDKDGRIEWMNQIAVQHFNLNQQQDTGLMLQNLIRLPEFHQLMVRDTDRTESIKIKLPKGKNQNRILNLSRTPFAQKMQLVVSQDISDIEHMQLARSHFVANVSHELRTPLTVITGFLETLADMPDLPAEQKQQFIGLMQHEGTRMLNLLNDLLTLSKLESHEAQPQLQALNLSALVAQVCHEGQTLSKGQHRFHIDLAPDVWIDGIQLDLYNALSNLVFNAVRYTPPGGDVWVRLYPIEDQACFSVRDNGPGIAPDHIPRLTERFYRVDAGRSRNQGGTGLGLAITKHALAAHDSALIIDSELGYGSTFSACFALGDAPPSGIVLGAATEPGIMAEADEPSSSTVL